MTTSHAESHIKPIIVSHQCHQHQAQDIKSALENNVCIVPKSTSSSFKRVSFGNSKGTVVETFIYESVPTIEEGYYGPPSPSTPAQRQDDRPPSRVKVKTLESQIPFHISPPSTIVGVAKLNNGAVAGGETALNRATPSSGLQRMDEGADNPFRPDGRLSHEVDPIVECYKTRPFPSSPGSDFMDGAVVGAGSSRSPSSTGGQKGSTSPPAGKASKNGRDNSAKPQDIKLTLTSADGRNTQLEVQHRQLMSPKAGHGEVVHIGEKRKRCGCCSVQ